MEYIKLGAIPSPVSRLSLGCWPMAGITTLDVDDTISSQTIDAALELGVNFFDTAYSYGYDGRSDRLLSSAKKRSKWICDSQNDTVLNENAPGMAPRSAFVIATKVGQHWNEKQERIVDASPTTLISHTKESLGRLGTDSIDLLYLHGPDPNVPIEESASTLAEMRDKGWAKSIGLCNATLEQTERFASVCKLDAIQVPFNFFQQQRLQELREYATANHITLVCYWVLMKGLLAGAIDREHRFDPRDVRMKYEIFQGRSWDNAHRLLDTVRRIAREERISVPQTVIEWALQPDRADVVLFGARNPMQIEENVLDARNAIPAIRLAEIDELLEKLPH